MSIRRKELSACLIEFSALSFSVRFLYLLSLFAGLVFCPWLLFRSVQFSQRLSLPGERRSRVARRRRQRGFVCGFIYQSVPGRLRAVEGDGFVSSCLFRSLS